MSYGLAVMMDSESSLQQGQSERLYFAFGSNLHLGQMVKRCPESRYIGTAKLHGYRFQINERGFANVLPSRGDYVEGLVYLLNLKDEARLDKSEGVPTAYQKHNLAVEVFTAAVDHVGRAVSELAQRLDDSSSPLQAPTESIELRSDSLNHPISPIHQKKGFWSPISKIPWAQPRDHREKKPSKQAWVAEQTDVQARYDSSRRFRNRSPTGQATNALVYLSVDYQRDSKPRDEYVNRMNAGILDARRLGMSNKYIDSCIRPYIKDREQLNQGFLPAQQEIPESPFHRLKQPGLDNSHDPRSKHQAKDETAIIQTIIPPIARKGRQKPESLSSDDEWDAESDPYLQKKRYGEYGRCQ